jgi:hypothetical protein
MHVYRSYQPEDRDGQVGTAMAAECLDVRRRQQEAEVVGVPRCPRCRAVLVAGVKRGMPGFFCRCIARQPIPA